MSQCIVPKWNLRQVDEGAAGEERNRSPHVCSDQNLCYVVPMCSNHEVTELTWQNGQLSMHGIVGPKATWDGGKLPGGTLESIVDQATCYRRVEDGGGAAGVKRKSAVEESACGSASAAFCRDTADTTMMTWPSFESPRSMKTARTADDDSVYHDCSENQVEGERTTKEESCRSHSSARQSRAAAVHNLSERRRRDRINQKMKTLQKLVPNASKTDKASMLDEVIEYLKQLQAQVHMMSNARNMSPIMMPLGMQQLHMSLLARMSMGMGMAGMGMGLLDVNNMSRNHHLPQSFPSLIHPPTPLTASTPSFVPQPFTMPTAVPSPTVPMKANVDQATAVSDFNDAYSTFIAQQSMDMDFLNKVQSALYRQQGSHQQPDKVPVNLPLPNHAQVDSHDNFYTKCKEM